jgi:hypothetical protein
MVSKSFSSSSYTTSERFTLPEELVLSTTTRHDDAPRIALLVTGSPLLSSRGAGQGGRVPNCVEIIDAALRIIKQQDDEEYFMSSRGAPAAQQ